ncbi:MAG: protein kinase [Chloroflexota bacterium]
MDQLTRSLIGHKLGDYEILEKIGMGGMANVFKAIDRTKNHTVAIKLIHPFLLEDRLIVRRFRMEAEVMARLTHPNIVKTFGFQTDEYENHYLVMEYIQGRTLKAYLSDISKISHVSHLQFVVDLIAQVGDAVGYAHERQMIHRDIKPGNVMITPEGRAVLMDFGIVKLLDATSAMTATGSLLGTPAYMSPEQALGEPGDTRGDIYSLGVMLFQMVTGELPFDAETPMGIIMKHVSEPPPLPGLLNPATPLSLHDVLWKSLEKDPNNRFQTAVSFVNALKAVDLSEDAPKAPTQFEAVAPNPALLDTISSPPLPAPFQIPPVIPNFSQRNKTVKRVIDKLSDQSENQVVGLVGFGGVGKTAVGIHAIRELQTVYPDGILWVQLEYSTPEAELVKIADAFGQAEEASKKYTLQQKGEFVRQILTNKKILMVLDNAQDSDQIKWLLPTGKQNDTLITTRNHKMLQSLSAHIITVNPFSENEAIEYLANVIGAERILKERSFAKELGRLVGGLPLALSIVASLLNEANDISIEEYVHLLRDEKTRLANLTDWEDITRDVAASFELSYQTLPPPLQQLFANLAIFDGPDFAARDVAVIAKIPPVQTKLGLGRLHSLSLIGTGLGERELNLPVRLADEGRYQINPLLRAFAREKLQEKYNALRKRAAEYFANMAKLNTSFEDYSRLDLEWPNIFGALSYAYENQQWDSLVMGTLTLTEHRFGNFGFMDARGFWKQASTLLNWSSECPTNSEIVQVKLLNRLAAFAIKMSDWEQAKAYLSENSVRLANEPASLEAALEKATMFNLNTRLAQQNDPQEALNWLNQSLETLSKFTDTAALHEKAHIYIERSAILLRVGQLDEGIESAEVGLNLLPKETTPALIGGYLNLTVIYYYQGKLEQSIQSLLEVMPIAEEIGDFRRLANAAMNLGIMQEQLGQFKRASRNYLKSLRLHKALGNSDDEGSAHLNLGSLYIKLGQDAQAKDHIETAVSLAKQFNLSELELFAYAGQADFYLTQKNWRKASESIDHINNSKQTIPNYLYPSYFRLKAKAAWLKESLDEALAFAKEGLEIASNDSFVLEEGMCWRIIGRIQQSNKSAQAREAFEKSITLLDGQSPYEFAKTQLAFAKFLLTVNEPLNAKDYLQNAKEAFSRLSASRELKETLDILSTVQ